MAWISRVGWAMACVLPLAACERDMEDQAKFEPYEAAIRALQLSQHATLREVREAGLESRLGAAR